MKLDVKELISKVTNKLNAIGTTYTASWTATSTSANLARVTSDLTLPKGTYLFTLKAPACSPTSGLYFGLAPFGLEFTSQFLSQGVCTTIGTLSSTTTIYGTTNMSQSTNYTYIERGYLKAVRIA